MNDSRVPVPAARAAFPLALLWAAALLATATTAYADSGFYVGGSVGTAAVEVNDVDPDLDFDEDDFAWKVFGGYNIDAFVIDLAVEGGYVDFGSPSDTLGGSDVALDLTGWDVFGLAGVELGPIGVFAKAGLIAWDGDATIDGVNAGGDSGTDPAYGVGVRFSLWSAEIRAEYEYFDIDDTDDVSLLSAGIVWTF